MGVPVSGKNLFPSNIQGQPTWFTIRLSKEGYLAPCDDQEIFVAMNPDSFLQDIQKVAQGGVLFYDSEIPSAIDRDDITKYPIPIKTLIKSMNISPQLRTYAANMVYVGVVAQILGVDMGVIHRAVDFHFKGKKQAIDMNYGIIESAYQWSCENLIKSDPFYVEPMNKTEEYILVEGNTAAALGALYGGVQFVSWYPITPASSLAEDLIYYLPSLRMDPLTGKKTCVVLQAEDELAAIGMAIGAGWSGLRAMSSTSGPGISLMAEFTGLAYFTETPIVIWNVQRVGPSTGLPTRTAQGDLTFTYFLGHGDTDNIILLPCDPHECFEFGWKSLDYAEHFQTPVFVLSDLDLGMQQWMVKRFRFPDTPIDRGKVLWDDDLEKMIDQKWGRYLDVDHDGIPYRTVPGNRHPASAYMARGTGHNEYAKYSESPEVWERLNIRLKTKHENARSVLPQPVIEYAGKKTSRAVIAYGSTWSAVEEARDYLRDEDHLDLDFLRIRALPFSDQVKQFAGQFERIYIVELNRDGQMCQLLCMAYPDLAQKFISLCHVDGLPMTANWLRHAILEKEGKVI